MLWNRYCIIVRHLAELAPEALLERVGGCRIRLVGLDVVDQSLHVQVHGVPPASVGSGRPAGVRPGSGASRLAQCTALPHASEPRHRGADAPRTAWVRVNEIESRALLVVTRPHRARGVLQFSVSWSGSVALSTEPLSGDVSCPGRRCAGRRSSVRPTDRKAARPRPPPEAPAGSLRCERSPNWLPVCAYPVASAATRVTLWEDLSRSSIGRRDVRSRRTSP